MTDWYYDNDGKTDGPHSVEDIESLVAVQRVSRDTLVWRDGMEGWQALGVQSEFKDFFKALPPPLPGAKPAPLELIQPTGVTEFQDSETMERSPAIDSAEVPEEEQAAPVNEPIFTPRSQSFPSRLAGPWSRYFARSIDLSLIATAIATGLTYGMPYVSIKAALAYNQIDPRVLFIVLLPVAHFVNALIITTFGNSLGKGLFGMQMVPLDGRHRYSLTENIKREFNVWTQGLALGIPIFSLFTLVPIFKKVSVGQPAPYDFMKAEVRSHSDSALRRTVAMLFAMSLYLAIAYLNVLERQDIEAMHTSTSWANPTTRMAVTIPAGWQYELVPVADGSTLYGFTNVNTGVIALLGVETVPNASMQQYTTALKSVLSDNTKLGTWAAAVDPTIVTTSGAFLTEKWPTTVYVTQVGDAFWRIVYIDQTSTTPHQIQEPDMTRALFQSFGKQTGGL